MKSILSQLGDHLLVFFCILLSLVLLYIHRLLKTYHLFLCDLVKENLLIAERDKITLVHEFEYSWREGVRLKVRQLSKDTKVGESCHDRKEK